MVDYKLMRENMVLGQILPERIVNSEVIEAYPGYDPIEPR